MTENTRLQLHHIIATLGGPGVFTQRHMAALLGRDASTVYHYLHHGVIPRVTCDWLQQVQEIRIQPGYAVIVVGMPADTPSAEWRK